jgi:lipoyl-dependent peroxiredoxin subunit D
MNTERIDQIFENQTSTIARDLKLNWKRILGEGALSPDEAASALLATATSVGLTALIDYAKSELSRLELTPEQIQEARESAAIMGMLNTYYRFRHMIAKDDDYRTAGLRMTALAKPALGKVRFEMLAFAVSVINGCEKCIRSHEAVLLESGVTIEKIHDLARLAAVTKGLSVL